MIGMFGKIPQHKLEQILGYRTERNTKKFQKPFFIATKKKTCSQIFKEIIRKFFFYILKKVNGTQIFSFIKT
jgi:hypothetical protein